MDNRIFNVNGKGDESLLTTLSLVFGQHGKNTKCAGYYFSKDHGLILLWYCEGNSKKHIQLPEPLTAEQICPVIIPWLTGNQAASMTFKSRWDGDEDHDGSNGNGWRVYCEDWGHVNDDSAAICAVRPVYLWYGK